MLSRARFLSMACCWWWWRQGKPGVRTTVCHSFPLDQDWQSLRFCHRHHGSLVLRRSSQFDEEDLALSNAGTAAATVVARRWSRDEASRIIDRELLPGTEYGRRIKIGREAQGLNLRKEDSAQDFQVLRADDPCLAQTYGEFPLSSLDTLLDLALPYCRRFTSSNHSFRFVDVGSGCGRLCAYIALTRGEVVAQTIPWHVHGIELAHTLHHEAVATQRIAMEHGYILADEDSIQHAHGHSNIWQLHQGAVADYVSSPVMQDAHLLFCYSTTWTTSPPITSCIFDADPEYANQLGVGALVLSEDWCRCLAEACPNPGTVIITTDRALDPRFGWQLVHRADVPNPEIWGSIGYIHIRTKSKDKELA